MRTTVAVDDQLLASAKHEAHKRGLTLGQLIEEALQLVLSRPPTPAPRPPVPVVRGGRVRPGVDITSNRSILEALDEGLAMEKLH